MARYSLANYILTLRPNDTTLRNFGSVVVGGEGNYTDSISVSLDNNTFSTTGFATGAWVHNKSLSKTGTATISLSQVSDQVAKFIQFAKLFYSGDYEGFTISVTTNDGTPVVYCYDCYFKKIPDQSFGENAATQSWVLTCGEVDFQ